MPIPPKNFPWQMLKSRCSSMGRRIGEGKSDASGAFTVTLRTRLWIGRQVTLKFRHADYQPLDMREFVGDKLYLAHMVPVPHDTTTANHPPIVVSNVLARYSIKTTNTANVGSAVQDLQSREYRQRAMPEAASLFARREMEGGNGLGVARCRRRKRISQCANFMHRGAVSVYQDRSRGFSAGRPRGESVGAQLVGYGHVPAGGRSVPPDGQRTWCGHPIP